MFKEVEIYTDGSCLKNPGNGGYCILMSYQKYIKIYAGFKKNTTNNRMELIAIINALELLKQKCFVNLTTDSKYVQLGIIFWIKKWKKNKWKTIKKKPVKNIDLWKKLYIQNEFHKINWIWTKSHKNNINNNLCDRIAKIFSKIK